jgi:uncharacterized membrane protein YhaH (DUF805 family)
MGDGDTQRRYTKGAKRMETIKLNPAVELTSEERRKVLLALYDRCRSEWIHYDSHVWQIPSLAIALNAFLLGQTFNPQLLTQISGKDTSTFPDLMIFRSMILFLAGLFTFVLLIALVKHRLHQRSKDQNIKEIENLLGIRIEPCHFEEKSVLDEIDPNPTLIQRWLSPLKTNHWLAGVMGLTILIDAVLFIGVVSRWW